MSQPPLTVVFAHPAQPDWGYGVVLEERTDKVVMQFEHGGARVFKKQGNALQRVELSGPDASALGARLRGRRAPAVGSARNTKKKSAAASKAVPIFASFEAQLKWFDDKFPGGFEGAPYVAGERGKPGAERKAGHKEWAIALAQTQLSPERFATDSSEQLFESLKKVLSATNIIHPQEGLVAFGAIPEDLRAGVVKAAQELLHGDGEYGSRLQRLASRLPLVDGEGRAKAVTWPTATVLGALYSPAAQVAVKPTYFSLQAALLGLELSKTQLVTAGGYARFLAVAQATQERLVSAGHKPRDLMDVYLFISRSHAAKPKPAAAAAKVPPASA
jgi:hypothetical protein